MYINPQSGALSKIEIVPRGARYTVLLRVKMRRFPLCLYSLVMRVNSQWNCGIAVSKPSGQTARKLSRYVRVTNAKLLLLTTA